MSESKIELWKRKIRNGKRREEAKLYGDPDKMWKDLKVGVKVNNGPDISKMTLEQIAMWLPAISRTGKSELSAFILKNQQALNKIFGLPKKWLNQK
jgi:hypothetical protein